MDGKINFSVFWTLKNKDLHKKAFSTLKFGKFLQRFLKYNGVFIFWKRTKMKFFSYLLTFSLTLTAVFSSTATLNFARIQDASTLDPALESDLYSAEVIANIFEGLVKVDYSKNTVSPQLAEKWTTDEESKVWRFYLRKGVKFHDGTELNADAVVFSILRFKEKNRERFRSFFPYFESIRKIDDYTVEFRLSKPDSVFLFYLTMPGTFIVSLNCEKKGKFTSIGTGPFKLEEWKKGKYISLVSNKDYWDRPSSVDKVVFITIPSTEWRLLQLKNGNAHLLRLFSIREYDELKYNPFIKTKVSLYSLVNYLGFNTKKALFRNRKVREAIAHIINKKKLVKLLLPEYAKPAVSTVNPLIPGFNPELKDYEYNPEKARKLLAEAGYPHGFTCDLYSVQGRRDLKDFLLKLKMSAESIGIKINLKFLPFKELYRIFSEGKHDLFALGWTTDIPDASTSLESLLYSKGKNNYSFYNNPELDQLIEKARTTLDKKEREKLYMKAQQIIHDDVAMVPLFYSSIIIAHLKNVKGITVNFRGQVHFKNAKIEK